MAVITKQELEDAAVDADDLELFVNGAVDLNGNGTFTTRLGRTVKTLAKIQAEAEADFASQVSGMLASFQVFETEVLGRLAVGDGEYFKVPEDSNSNLAYILYKRIDASSSELIAQVPKKAYVDSNINKFLNEGGEADSFYICDKFGFVIFYYQDSKLTDFNFEILEQKLKLGSGASFENTTNEIFSLVDKFGFSSLTYEAFSDSLKGFNWLFNKNKISNLDFEIYKDSEFWAFSDKFGFCSLVVDVANGLTFGNGFSLESGKIELNDFSIELTNQDHKEVQFGDRFGFFAISQESLALNFSEGEIQNYVQAAVASSLQYPTRLNLANILPGQNHHISTGQSLSTAQEAWPELTGETNVNLDLYMIGDSSRPNNKTSESWSPLGVNQLNLLKSVVQTEDFTSLMTASEVAALPEGSNRPGEQIEIAALVTLKEAMLANLHLERDPTRKIINTACGVGGKSVQELSNGASPDYFNRIENAIALAKGFADANNENYQVLSVLHIQGEANLGNASNFKNDTEQYFQQIENSAIAVSAQSLKPAFFTYQTRHTSGSQDNEIAQAQLELALENDNVFLAAPHYQVTDKGTHLDANGSRWLGCYIGKVMYRVLIEKINWKPLHCTEAFIRNKEIILNFFVPNPPLKFDSYFHNLIETNLQNKGFSAYNDGVEVSIEKVELIGPCSVKITLSETPEGTVKIRYADGGNGRTGGNLCDSDSFVAPFNYEYSANSGQDEEANITQLVNKPYPLQNYCVAFKIQPTEV